MNATNAASLLFAVTFSWNLLGNQLILQSRSPLPESLQTAIEEEVSQAGLIGQGRANIFVQFHGSCRIPNQPLDDVERPLGWVDRVDGQMLSIVHVDCARIGQALRRVVTDPQSAKSQDLLARAIARVIRHELHHLVLQTSDHDRTGDFKSALRAEELIAPFATAAFH
jgi:hypothetical protein